MKYTFGTIILASTISFEVAASTDFVECMRNKSTFKQFCFVKEDTINDNLLINKTVTVGTNTIDLTEVFQNAEVTIYDAVHSDIQLNLLGLRPKGIFDTIWSNDSTCLVSQLWKDDIKLEFIDNNSGQVLTLRNMNPGTSYMNYNFSDYKSDSFSPYYYETVNDDLRLSADYRLNNIDHHENRPLAYERIPNSCNLTVRNSSIGFNTTSLSQDLDTLTLLAYNEIQVRALTTTQHASYVNTSIESGQCVIKDTAETLKTLELSLQRPVFNYSMLTALSKNMIANIVQQSVVNGWTQYSVIPDTTNSEGETVKDYFGYALTTTFNTYVSENCGVNGEPIDYTVSRSPFVTVVDGLETIDFPPGVANSEVYAEATTNLRNITLAAHAIVQASIAQLGTYDNPEWLLSGAANPAE